MNSATLSILGRVRDEILSPDCRWMDNMPKMDVYLLPFISSRNDTIIVHQSRFGLGKEASTSNEN
jgi:hypothetical protein